MLPTVLSNCFIPTLPTNLGGPLDRPEPGFNLEWWKTPRYLQRSTNVAIELLSPWNGALMFFGWGWVVFGKRAEFNCRSSFGAGSRNYLWNFNKEILSLLTVRLWKSAETGKGSCVPIINFPGRAASFKECIRSWSSSSTAYRGSAWFYACFKIDCEIIGWAPNVFGGLWLVERNLEIFPLNWDYFHYFLP